MPAMIDEWRRAWSTTPGTTDPAAPFGLVALPASGSEGGPNMGAFRWAQTANYGVAPNPAMPNTFLAQAYDLNDPWGDKSCAGFACCPYYAPRNETMCIQQLARSGLPPTACETYCEVRQLQPMLGFINY